MKQQLVCEMPSCICDSLAGAFDKKVNSLIFGGRLIALSKKDEGIQPIYVSYTLRRLATKCADNSIP